MIKYLNKKGVWELLTFAVLCALYWIIGLPWAAGLVLGAALFVLFAFTAVIVNYACLIPDARDPWLNCILFPYTTLMAIVPFVLVTTGVERVLSDVDAQLDRDGRE